MCGTRQELLDELESRLGGHLGSSKSEDVVNAVLWLKSGAREAKVGQILYVVEED